MQWNNLKIDIINNFQGKTYIKDHLKWLVMVWNFDWLSLIDWSHIANISILKYDCNLGVGNVGVLKTNIINIYSSTKGGL